MKMQRKSAARDLRSTLKELPYFNFAGNLVACHGQTNNSAPTLSKSKRNLDSLPGLHSLDLFSLNSGFDRNLNPDNNLGNQRIQSHYFSLHSFKILGNKLSLNKVNSSISIFHNNVVSLNHNLENVMALLDELDFHFDVIGVTETKITNSNVNEFHPNIPGYCFECVPMPLASGGVGMFIKESLNHNVLEKTSIWAFQALWIEISFVNNKNIICGIIYCQHNSPEYFQSYFEDHIGPMIASKLPYYPWQKVASDKLFWKGKTCLLMVGHYTHYIEVSPLASTTSQSMIGGLKTIFSRFGFLKRLSLRTVLTMHQRTMDLPMSRVAHFMHRLTEKRNG